MKMILVFSILMKYYSKKPEKELQAQTNSILSNLDV